MAYFSLVRLSGPTQPGWGVEPTNVTAQLDFLILTVGFLSVTMDLGKQCNYGPG